jgi:2-oxoglutarate ferredoxin oxidoreductase subunit beta
LGKVAKSTPMGSVDHPFNPLALSLGADGTFIARTMDRDPIHMREILKRANAHKGTSLVEIYQNCNVFNDGAFEVFTEKGTKKLNTLTVENGKPLIFGEQADKGIKLDGFKPIIVNIADVSANDLWIHDETDPVKASILVRFFDNPANENALPRPFGVFYKEDRFCYEDAMNAQIEEAIQQKGKGNLDALIRGKNTWTI